MGNGKWEDDVIRWDELTRPDFTAVAMENRRQRTLAAAEQKRQLAFERIGRLHHLIRALGYNVGWIYVVANAELSDGRFKIGYSAGSLLSRLSTLQIGSPYLLSFAEAWLVPRAREAEISLHERLITYRRHGEWFRLDEDGLTQLRTAVWEHVEQIQNRSDRYEGERAALLVDVNDGAQIPNTDAR